MSPLQRGLTAPLSNNPVSERIRQALIANVREQLSVDLPGYMHPDRIVVLDTLPRLSNGKVDHAKLGELAEQPGRQDSNVAPPRDHVELQLVQMWEEILGITPIGIHDEFVRLGGNSLVALRLLARMRGRLGAKIELSSLFSGVSIADLAASIRNDRSVAGNGLIDLAKGSGGSPLFCFHGGGGSVLPYRHLAAALPFSRPVVGIQAAGLEAGDLPRATLSEMAERAHALIRERQPEGPYVLVGWSFGGVLAFETGKLLQVDGSSVALVVIDSAATLNNVSDADLRALVVTQVGREVGKQLELDISSDDAFGERLAQALCAQGGLFAELGQGEVSRLANLALTNLEALRKHRIDAPFAGNIKYLRAKAGHQRDPDTLSRWQSMAAGKFSHEVLSGDHFSLLDPPHVFQVGEAIGRYLASEGFT